MSVPTRHTLAQLRPDLAAQLGTVGTDNAVRLLTQWLEYEMNEHLATCNRWIAIEAELKTRIAKARKIMRAHRLRVHPAYTALNAPRGRR